MVGEPTLNVLPFPLSVPWRNLTVLIPLATYYADPVGALRAALREMTPDRYAAKRRILARHLPDLIWSHPRSRVEQSIIREALDARCPLQKPHPQVTKFKQKHPDWA